MKYILCMLLLISPLFSEVSEVSEDSETNHSEHVKKDLTYIAFFAMNKDSKFPVYIDKDHLPEIPFPKDDIVSIEISQRKVLENGINNTAFVPTVWYFYSDNQRYKYHGTIPHLENLATIDQTTNITTITITTLKKNPLGYYQDENGDFGIYQSIHGSSQNNINKFILLNEQPSDMLFELVFDQENMKQPLLPLPKESETIDETNTVKQTIIESENTTTPPMEQTITESENKTNKNMIGINEINDKVSDTNTSVEKKYLNQEKQ